MKKVIREFAVVGALFAAPAFLNACAYGGVASVGDRVVITRINGFFFGILRKVYVCDVGPSGVTNCQSADSP